MAHTLTLSDGTTTIDLAVTSGNGVYLSQFVPPAGDRKATRVGPVPTIAGQRTIVSTLADNDAHISGMIVGSSTNNVEATYLGLIRLLELARNWEESRFGSPVYLSWKRQGATNTAYWTVTGIPQLPQPTGAQNWLDEETIANQLTYDMTLTLEPVAHAATMDAIKAATGVTTVYGSNTVTCSTTNGDVNGPINVAVTKTSVGNSWQTVWLAQIVGTPDVTDYIGTADVSAYGGSYQQQTGAGLLSFTGTGYNLTSSQQHTIRGFIRMRVTTAPTAGVSAVQIRMRLNIGSVAGRQITMDWVNFPGVIGAWTMVDLGAIPRLTSMQNRIGQTSASFYVTIEMQSADATSMTVRADYATFFAYYGFAKITGVSITPGDTLYYEDTYSANSGAYVAPRQATQVYEATSGVNQTDATRYGRLTRIPGNTAPVIWMQAQNDTNDHLIADTGTVKVDHLPCYASGLRGAG